MKILLIIAIMFVVSACVTQKSTEHVILTWQQQIPHIEKITQWTLKARVAIKKGNEGNTLNLNWQHKDDIQILKFYSPVGTTIGVLQQTNTESVLNLSNDQQYRAENLSELIQHVLGYPLPVEKLEVWIMGLAVNSQTSKDVSYDMTYKMTYDSLGYPKMLQNEHWTVQFSKYKHFPGFKGLTMPSKLKITKEDLSVKLSIKQWIIGTEL